MYITTASSQAETAYQLFMKETRATNTSLPKGKEAMVLIGEMWSKLPVGRRRPVRSFVQRHRCRTANETFTRPHRKRKRAPIKIGQRSPGKNTKKSSPSITLARKLPRKRMPPHRRPRLLPRSARSPKARTAARRKRWRSSADERSLQIYVYNLESFTRFMQSPPVSLVFSRTAKKEQEEGQGHGVRPCVSGCPPSGMFFCLFYGFYRLRLER